MSRLSRFLALVAVLSLGLAAAPAVALASPDAKVDQQIRPCFGLLLDPNLSRGCKVRKTPVKARCRRGEIWVRGRCTTTDLPPPREINCDVAYPGQISETLARLYDGDVLTLTSREGGACYESLEITRAVTIVVRDYTAQRGRPILVAPPGKPCIQISPGVPYVVLEGLGIDALRAGDSACITGRATELTLRGVTVRYDGLRSALDIGDSRIEIVDSVLIGRTRKPVAQVTGELRVANLEIAATAIGMAVETSGDSRLSDVRINRLGDWTGSTRTRNSAGFVMTGMNRQQLAQIDGLRVDGFSRGIYIGGGDETTLLRPTVLDSDWAVVVEDANLRVIDGDLEAIDVGLYAASGTLNASGNKIVGVMRSGLFAEKGVQVRARDNRIYAHDKGCEALVTGYFADALTCRPWYEAPELFRNPRNMARLDFDTYWPAPTVTPAEATAPPPELAGAPHSGGMPK